MASSLFERAGGGVAMHRLAERFYTLVFDDALLAPLFRDPDEDHPERLALWLGELLGGPAGHTEARGGFAVMLAAHEGLRITPDQRARWVALMRQATVDVGIPADVRRDLEPYLEGGSTYAMRASWPPDQRGPR